MPDRWPEPAGAELVSGVAVQGWLYRDELAPVAAGQRQPHAGDTVALDHPRRE